MTGAGAGSDDDNFVPLGSPIRTADCLIAVGEQFKNAVAGWLDKRKEDPAKFEKSKHDREEIIKKELERFADREREYNISRIKSYIMYKLTMFLQVELSLLLALFKALRYNM